MPILWEGGEEGGISAETPLVGAFHVFQFQLSSRAAPMVPPVSFFPVRRPSLPCGVLGSRAARCVPPHIILFRSVVKNNPCVFLPRKKKQKAASMPVRVPPPKTTRVFSFPIKRNKKPLKRNPAFLRGFFGLPELDELHSGFLTGERFDVRVHLIERHHVSLYFVDWGVRRDVRHAS